MAIGGPVLLLPWWGLLFLRDWMGLFTATKPWRSREGSGLHSKTTGGVRLGHQLAWSPWSGHYISETVPSFTKWGYTKVDTLLLKSQTTSLWATSGFYIKRSGFPASLNNQLTSSCLLTPFGWGEAGVLPPAFPAWPAWTYCICVCDPPPTTEGSDT